MLAWSEGTDNGRQKTRNHGYDVIVGDYLLITLRSPSQTCHADKTQINRRRTLCSFFPLVGCLPPWLGLKDFSPKSQDLCGDTTRLRSVALFTYDWSWWYPSGNRPLQQYLGFTAGRWLWIGSGHKADSLIAKFKEAGGTVREIDVWAESPRLSPLWLSASSVTCHGLLIITVITPYQSPARQKCRRTEAGERGNYWHADASAWCSAARCKIHEGVSWC